ncbi:MAG: FAD-binding oxidoreductase [Gammaproteobacteria bacterium]|nr:FAD-binding oxidoreductase [Gammaproteobacteria bacterium]
MLMQGWGRYPKIEAELLQPLTITDCKNFVKNTSSLIARGLGRSYGDSSLANNILGMKYLNHFLTFDKIAGVICCGAGVSINELLNTSIPHGWFLPVTPGTRYVTIGGAIASDVHGKNHHHEGAFSGYVINLQLLLSNGEIVTASATEHSDLFKATCGGMGLTGIILSANIKLKPIKSSCILQTTIKSYCLDEALEKFEQCSKSSYSVAWIDCLATGKHLGRSVLTLGEHAENGTLTREKSSTIPVFFDLPGCFLTSKSIKAFNLFYHGKISQKTETKLIKFNSFFYPLDNLRNWNYLYGKQGFIQYQFVLPKVASAVGLKQILGRIAQSGKGSFLAVLKLLGKENNNFISFPMEGYTLALDFKITAGLLELLEELDRMVLNFGGRIYLAKDARMTEKTFKSSYPCWIDFESVREKYGAIGKFSSQQSKRIGLQ